MEYVYPDPTNADEFPDTPVSYDVPKSKTASGNLTELVKKNGNRGQYSRKKCNGPSRKQRRPDRRCKPQPQEEEPSSKPFALLDVVKTSTGRYSRKRSNGLTGKEHKPDGRRKIAPGSEECPCSGCMHCQPQ